MGRLEVLLDSDTMFQCVLFIFIKEQTLEVTTVTCRFIIIEDQYGGSEREYNREQSLSISLDGSVHHISQHPFFFQKQINEIGN